MTQLSIPAPCSEKWSDMAPVRPDCRSCAACERQIVDFSQKTDAEILEYLKRNHGKICGRFHPTQLNRPIVAKRAARGGGLTAAAASVAVLLSAQQPQGNQSAPPPVSVQKPEFTDFSNPVQAKQSGKTPAQDSLRTISGKLTDSENGEPLIGCSIAVIGTALGAMTDVDGFFSLKLPVQFVRSQPVRLQISYTGYEAREIELPARVKEEDLSLLPVELKPDEAFASDGLVGIIAYTPTPLQRVRHFFYRLFH